MALPVSHPTVDGEEEAIHASDAAGYAQVPADHLSDSSESSYNTSDDLVYDAADAFPASETVMVFTHDNGNSVAPTGGCCSHQNVGSVDFVDATGIGALTTGSSSTYMDNQASSYNSGASHANDAHVDLQAETQNSSNDGHHPSTAQVQDHNNGTPDGHVINFNGMEIHVYGQLAGLQLSLPLNQTRASHDDVDGLEDVDESERQQQEDTAMLRAMEAEEARRSAPLPPERCQAIKEAMQNISLGGYRPEWADKISEEQWLNTLKRK